MENREAQTDDFCEKCLAESSDESSGSIKEGTLWGKEFMGNEDYCKECGAYTTILWKVILHIPYKAVGTYRYKHLKVGWGNVTFRTRKIEMNQELLSKTRKKGTNSALIMLAIVIVIIIVVNS